MKRTWAQKTIACLMCVLLILLAATAMAGDATTMNDGVYTGTGDGFGGKITVSVTVTDGKIAAIEVVEHSETEGVGTVALEKLPAEIIAAQGLGLDAVTGCTISSNGLLGRRQGCLDPGGRRYCPAGSDFS